MKIGGGSAGIGEQGWRDGLRLPVALMVLVGGGALAACSAARPKATCLTPRTESLVIPGDPNANNDPNTWDTGLIFKTGDPNDPGHFIERRVGFQDPKDGKPGWHDSNPLPAPVSGQWYVQIGPGAVVFSVVDSYPAGTPACNQPPNVEFGPVHPLTDQDYEESRTPSWP